MEQIARVVSILAFVVRLCVAQTTPAFFVFGDSLVDAGNNNYLSTRMRANFLPYGENFDTHTATGRFSDGRIITDFIAGYLGLPFPAPYMGGVHLDDLQKGANFASAGSGILNSTGAGTGSLTLARQISEFADARDRLSSALGMHNASALISKSLFYIGTGNFDFVRNYYASDRMQQNYTASEFQDLLVSVLGQQILELYNLDARNFVVSSVAALGCNPSSLYTYRIEDAGDCASTYETSARDYNTKLATLLNKLRSTLPDSYLLFANLYGVMSAMVKNGTLNGFSNVNQACCPFDGSYLSCLPLSPTCGNASTHIFWDSFHPTAAFNHMAARKFWSGDNHAVTPLSIRDLLIQA